MAGLLDFLNPPQRGGGLLDPQMQAEYRRQQVGSAIATIGDRLMALSQGHGIPAARQGPSQEEMLRLQEYQRQRQQQNSQQGAVSEAAGGIDPQSGITWNAGRRNDSQGGSLYTPQQQNALRAMGPQAASGILAQQQFPKPPEPYNLSPGEVRFGGNNDPLAAVPPKPDDVPTPIQEYQLAQEQGYKGSFRDFRLEMRKAGATSVNVGPQENAAQKYYGDMFVTAQKGAIESGSRASKFEQMGKYFEGVNTGAGADWILSAKKAGNVLGITDFDPATIGRTEAGKALANEMALQLRNPAGGAGMPGAMSDKDREFLTSMVPGIGTTPAGREIMVKAARLVAQRDKEVAKLARDYRRRNGSLDEGFQVELENFAEAHPLFSDMSATAAAPGGAVPADSSGWSIQRID